MALTPAQRGRPARRLLGTALLLWPLLAAAAWIDWWLTPDQQGRVHFERGEHERAARAFTNPEWKGLAFYAAGDFVAAAQVFAGIETAAGRFHLGNALAQQERLAEAVAAYREALTLRPDWEPAAFNLQWVQGLLELERQEYEDAGGTGGKLAADDFVFSDRAAGAQQTMTAEEAAAQGLTDAELERMWMRRVQTTPGDFLALKFAYQAQNTSEAERP